MNSSKQSDHESSGAPTSAGHADAPGTSEQLLRELWTSQGVCPLRQDGLIADIAAKAAPGAQIGPFRVPSSRRAENDGECPTVPVCPQCGSDNVVADAAARWSTETWDWEVSAIFDKGHGCEDCGAEDIEFAWVIVSVPADTPRIA